MNNVNIFALGGLDEDGKNMYAIEINYKIFIVNCGIKRNEQCQFGIDYIIPDFTYVLENKEKVSGIIITHLHDDMFEALPYLIRQANIPIYAPNAVCVFIRELMKVNDINDYRLFELPRSGNTVVDGVNLTTFPLTHSTPDAIGVAIDTPNGNIVIAEQYVIDFDQLDPHYNTDIASIADVGRKNVLCALIESSYADRPSFTSPKHRIANTINSVFEDAEGRIFFMVYEQNFYRIKEIVDKANEFGRSVFCFDEHFKKTLRLYSSIKNNSSFSKIITSKEMFDKASNDSVIIIPGNGYKTFNNMYKIAIGEDDFFELVETDTVVIASPAVSGIEKEAAAMENELYRDNVKIVKMSSKEVLSMHPSSGDIKMILSLLKPKYFLPTMGSYRNFISAADLAMEIGYTPDKIIILDNGQIANFEDGKLKSCANVNEQIGELLINEAEKTDVTSFIFKDRELLSTDGCIIIGVAIDFDSKAVIGGPDVQSRGVIYVKDSEYLIKNIGKLVIDTINEKVENGTYTNMDARAEIRDRVARLVLRDTGKRPMILPAIIEINV